MAQYALLCGNQVIHILQDDISGRCEIMAQRAATSSEKSTYSAQDLKTVHTAIKVK